MSLPALPPSALALLLSVVCAFVLRVTAAYGLALLLARIATSAAARFVIWLGFLAGASLYWLVCLARMVETLSGSAQPVLHAAAIAPRFAVRLTLPTTAILGRSLEAAVVLYAAALVGLALLGLWKRMQLRRAIRFRVEAPGPLVTLCRELAAEIGAPACNLWLLPGLASPASLGWAHPAIYLPADESLDPAPELRDILLHELLHLRRRDALWEALARACRSVIFFHPLARKAFGALRLERELACDLLVVRYNPEHRDSYADTLLRFGWKSSLAQEPDHIGIGFTSQAAVLTARIRTILEGERVYSRWSSGLRVVCSTGVCWLFAAVAPALWIGFNPAFLAISTVSVPETAKQPLLQSRRRAHSGVNRATSSPGLPDSAALMATQPVDLPSAAPHRTAFHVQNQDEPMFDPVPDSSLESRGGVDPGGPATRGASRAGSASTVLLRAATNLETMGVGRGGRDHDHD